MKLRKWKLKPKKLLLNILGLSLLGIFLFLSCILVVVVSEPEISYLQQWSLRSLKLIL